jgi:hypothetical protein
VFSSGNNDFLTVEVWLRGPVPGIPPLLQPVAHALLQAREEVTALMDGFPEDRLWDRPGGVASPGFHLQHLTGVLDRLFTYAAGKALSTEQLAELAAEGNPEAEGAITPDKTVVKSLVDRFNRQVDKAIDQLKGISEQTLTAARGVGRAQLPSTVLGLMVHAAEHTQRHTGQLLVTVKVLKILPQATP